MSKNSGRETQIHIDVQLAGTSELLQSGEYLGIAALKLRSHLALLRNRDKDEVSVLKVHRCIPSPVGLVHADAYENAFHLAGSPGQEHTQGTTAWKGRPIHSGRSAGLSFKEAYHDFRGHASATSLRA
ncbi:MAG: hypothetical protein L0Z50_22290 [Verrucomicrobiales bacterium]|nr:hypothetical protein [Verrucomicrobiales bacterium]